MVGPMSRFAAFEAKVVVKTPLSFFRGKFLNLDGIYIHGIGISFLLGMVVVVSVIEEGEEGVVPSFGNLIGPLPDLLEVESLLIPFFHGGWDSYEPSIVVWFKTLLFSHFLVFPH